MAISPNTTFVAGSVLTASQQNAFGFSTVALAKTTTMSQAGITSATDLTGATVTFTAIANRNYKVTWHTYATTTVAAGAATVTLNNGATILQYTTVLSNSTAGATFNGIYVGTFSAGSVTLKLVGSLGAGGSGTVSFVSVATLPTFVIVEDVGPA
jgi:predicted secreted Zn-dependent protease